MKYTSTISAALLSASVLALANPAYAQDGDVEEIIVTGIRSSLETALDAKRLADNLTEVIDAEDIGKLPDQNLAEVLENITGIQITRSAGVGTGVQIRGTDSNRVEINGVSTVGSGSGRSGISFEDLPAALIKSVEVTKSSEAKTIEGSVGGTVNLKTFRGLGLKGPVASFRAQAEHSDLSDGGLSPRISGTLGNRWETSNGDVGVVVSASYTEQDVSFFTPRYDRDRALIIPRDAASPAAESFSYFRTQFFDQDQRNQEYETLNLTGSVEWAPNDELTLYVDGTYNDQERIQQSYRVQGSGTGNQGVIDNAQNATFETINLGSVEGEFGTLDLGTVQAVTSGIIRVGTDNIPGRTAQTNPNMRTQTNTGSRITESTVFAVGGEWERDALTISAEAAISSSDTINPNLSTLLDFVNPRGPQPVVGQTADNGVPIQFDARGGTLQFGIAPGLANTPTDAELLAPENYRFRQLERSANTQENEETAFRIDGTYDTSDIVPFFTSVDAGLRYSVNTTDRVVKSDRFRLQSASSPNFFRPTGDLFSTILAPGADNFGDADDRNLFFDTYLVVSPELSVNNGEAVVQQLNTAIAAANLLNGVSNPLIQDNNEDLEGFFNIEEASTALYLQANYNTDAFGFPVRGNIGGRYVTTDVESVGNGPNAGDPRRVESSSYEFFLPRFNVVAEPMEDLLIRGGIGRDIRRPNFDQQSIATTFGGSAESTVNIGNPGLQPETVWSYDLSGEYYLSKSSLISVGLFYKERTDLFGTDRDEPTETNVGGQVEREIDPNCPGGGIFNPVADRNVFSSIQGNGICVARSSPFNVPGETTQEGIELGFQYNFSEWEDTLGWASGFGFIANYTHQESSGINNFLNGSGDGNELNNILGRTDTDNSTPTLADDVVTERERLDNLSEDSYNLTAFYDKFGLNARLRYTWRSKYDSPERSVSFGLPRIIGERGQLNGSLSYALDNGLTLGLEGVNLLREDRPEWCVNEGALLCDQGLTDRRIVGGVSYTF